MLTSRKWGYRHRTNKHRKTSYITILITFKCIAMPFYLLFFVLKGHTRLLNSTLLRLNRIRAPFTTPSVKSSRLISVDEKRGMSSLSSQSNIVIYSGPSSSYGNWIYNYMCNQCLSLSKKVCQWLVRGWWFSLGSDRHGIT
jgi:hypothetical protein